MTGPAWLAGGFAALMLLVAVGCLSRLALWRLRGRDTELDADGVHVLMGVAMAGMFEPRLRLLPDAVWLGLFATAAAWFAWQAIRARASGRTGCLRCAHPAPHAVECAVMLFMLRPAGPAGHGSSAAMPGMSGASASLAGNPALAVVLAVFIIGYMMWTTDRLAARSRAGTDSARAPGAQVNGLTLAPRLAACTKLAMSIGMGYMLVTML
jgi:Domain of unknown function (DUF5134)